MTKTSLIFNTACMDPLVRSSKNFWRTASYGDRVEVLKETIKCAEGFDEIIVAGTFEPGEGYQYVEVQPRFRDRRDALYQREFGARYSTGDVLVFCHDDHRPGEDFCDKLLQVYLCINRTEQEKESWKEYTDWDLLIPERRHLVTDEILNNGKEKGYMGGHCLVMKRWLWAEVPWIMLDTEYWDISMTRLWKEAGAKLLWVDDLVHYDCEATEEET